MGVAVVKVIAWPKSAGAARRTLRRVLAKAERAVDDWGLPVSKAVDVTEMWRLRDDDGRTAVYLLFSLPNDDPRVAWEAGLAAAQELFHDNPHVCALRTDTAHPHVNVLVRSRDYHGRKLNIDRATLRGYREALAQAGRARGVDVEARTPARQVPNDGGAA